MPNLFTLPTDTEATTTLEVAPGCEWVLAGEGSARQKVDGICVLLAADGTWWARRLLQPGEEQPAAFRPIARDLATGLTSGWDPIEHTTFADPFKEALEPLAQFGDLIGQPLEPGTFELIGPQINGNPEGASVHRLERHTNTDLIAGFDRTPEGIRGIVDALAAEGVEGIVFHHPDGRKAKANARDLGLTPAQPDPTQDTASR